MGMGTMSYNEAPEQYEGFEISQTEPKGTCGDCYHSCDLPFGMGVDGLYCNFHHYEVDCDHACGDWVEK